VFARFEILQVGFSEVLAVQSQQFIIRDKQFVLLLFQNVLPDFLFSHQLELLMDSALVLVVLVLQVFDFFVDSVLVVFEF